MRWTSTFDYVCVWLVCVVASAASAADVTGWRTDGSGAYPDADPPLHWSSDENVVWATPMPGWSNSSPVISGDRLFVCSEPATLLCVGLGDGQILWQRDNSTQQFTPPIDAPLPKAHTSNGHSSATPVTDGRRVFAVFGNGVAASYNMDGQRNWIQRTDTPNDDWGHSSSPVLVGDHLVIQIRDMVALDATTGLERWRTPSHQRWGTPIWARIGRQDTVITPNGEIILASNGQVMAKELAVLEYNAPLLHEDIVYFIQGRSHAYRLPKTVNDEPQHLWQQEIAKDRYYASPVIVDGLIYAITRNRHLTVLNASDGEKIYNMRLELGSGNVFASITSAGGYVFISSKDGTTVVLEPGREYREVARNMLEEFRSTPVFQGRRMYVRGLMHLYCIEAK